jgi:hypothetical protein
MEVIYALAEVFLSGFKINLVRFLVLQPNRARPVGYQHKRSNCDGYAKAISRFFVGVGGGPEGIRDLYQPQE